MFPVKVHESVPAVISANSSTQAFQLHRRVLRMKRWFSGLRASCVALILFGSAISPSLATAQCFQGQIKWNQLDYQFASRAIELRYELPNDWTIGSVPSDTVTPGDGWGFPVGTQLDGVAVHHLTEECGDTVIAIVSGILPAGSDPSTAVSRGLAAWASGLVSKIGGRTVNDAPAPGRSDVHTARVRLEGGVYEGESIMVSTGRIVQTYNLLTVKKAVAQYLPILRRIAASSSFALTPAPAPQPQTSRSSSDLPSYVGSMNNYLSNAAYNTWLVGQFGHY